MRRILAAAPATRLGPMCGIVGYVGDKQAQAVVIEGLRRLEYRGYDSAGIALVDRGTVATRQAGRQAGQPREGDRRDAAAGLDDRHRAHPLGDPRRPQRRQRPPAPRPHPAGGAGAQRHHRELRLAARRARGRRARDALGDRHRGRRPPARARARRRGRPHRGDAGHLPPPGGRLHAGRRRRRGPRPGGGGPPQLAAGRRARRRRELPRLRRGRVHRAHPRRARARPGPGRDHHPRGRERLRLRRLARGGHAVPRRLGPVGRREGRPRLVHAQGDLRAAARGRRLAARPPYALRGAAARRDAPLRPGGARHRQDHHHRRGDVVLRRHGREVRHRALVPDPGRGRAELGVPLPRPDPRLLDAGGRDQPVRRDRRHAPGDPARAGPEVQGARDLQHQRLDDPARVRRGHLHPRRPRDRRGLHQGLPAPSSWPATCWRSTSRR